MSKFLSGCELGAAITELMKGSELRCAVAFWGKGAVSKLFPDGGLPQNAKIICDLTMGSTNPEELKALGAPDNKKLKHLPGLHAKVYISEEGLITCSANASNNGIGFLDTARLVEAGTVHGRSTNAYNSALLWFEEIWNNDAKAIDDDALSLAQLAWDRRKAGNTWRAALPQDPASLLDAVIADPMRFRGVGFAFSTGNSTSEQRDETAEAVAAKDKSNYTPLLSNAERKALKKWPVGDVFSEWEPEDIRRWPEHFVCAHRGVRSQRLSYWFYERAHTAVLEGARGMLFGRRRRDLKRSFGFSKGAKTMAEADNDKASHVFAEIDKTGHPFFFANGEELARFLATLTPWR
ncbi:phospholipase D family protein [Methylosinus sp. RM1]|uniref:phospholipase D family protein n=1 Tax=Methylosinus sp. RM1 TaxID=2583817 RepID=UPI00140754E8|nr:phospholipase D family protein [Methylosinus sp. RM1]